jgi:hypothetical protein
MRDRNIVLPLVGFVILGLGTAFFLVPKGDLGQEARLTALSGEEALALLNVTPEPLSPRLAFWQAELTAEAGDGLLADQLLADLTARTEPSAVISAARADLALRAGDLQKRADYLAAAQDLAPSSERRQKLAGIYRNLGDRTAERQLLSDSPLTELTGSELLRLVDLTAADGALEEALEIARAALPLAGQSAPALADRFAAIALSIGQSNLLAQTASAWLSQPEAQSVAASLAKVLALRPRTAKAFTETVVSKTPDARVLLVKAFTEVRLFDVARLLLEPWTNAGQMTTDKWDAVIFYADRSGDIRPLEHLLQMQPEQKPPKSALLPLIRYDGEAALLPYQRWLTPEYLGSAPLVEAAWALTRQRPDEAFAALHQAARTEHDQALWHALASKLAGTEYFDRLHGLAEDTLD